MVSSSTGYWLRCAHTGCLLSEDADALPMRNPDSDVDSLLRTEYPRKQITFGTKKDDLYRFADWLPLHRRIPAARAPIAYHSQNLARHLGLPNLHICFSGYWPERQAFLQSTTFKECEANVVYSRMQPTDKTLVVASAGNTARAFATTADSAGVSTVVIMPEQNLDALWLTSPPSPLLRLIAIAEGDYADAIAAAELLSSLPGFMPEGGARNVARRDGMATCFLAGTEAIGRVPAHYFQSIGSGTGALAAWEAYHRLIRDGNWGREFLTLHLSQNSPFLLIYDSWKQRTRFLVTQDPQDLREKAAQIFAPVLSNRQPPYSLVGGVYDALSATEGQMYAIDNDQAKKAGALFEQKEGIDINPAAAVTVASLLEALERQTIGRTDTILLNITGGGAKRIQEQPHTFLRPHATIHHKDISKEILLMYARKEK